MPAGGPGVPAVIRLRPAPLAARLRAWWRSLRQPAASRPLTAGEAAIARRVFGDAIDCAAVRVHARGYLWFGLQPAGVAMAPCGEIHFVRADYRDDFSTADAAHRRWFVHELAHVWQHQLGYPVKWRGALRLGLRYDYALAPGGRLCDHDMEAQAELIADWYALAHLGAPAALRRPCAADAAAETLARYEEALAGFLADPRCRANLPRPAWRRRRGAGTGTGTGTG